MSCSESDHDDVVDLTEAEPVPAGASGYDPEAVLREDEQLQWLNSQAKSARGAVAERSLALSKAKAELHRYELAIGARTKTLVEEAEKRVDWVGRAFPWDHKLADVLRDTFKISSFRPLQKEAINAYLSKRDVFAILPTAAGKSLIYQACAVVAGGITVVVSPLLSLMHDQARQLRKLKLKAYCLDSNTPKDEVGELFATVLPSASKKRASGTVILFVTPERCAKSKKLLARLQLAYNESPRALSHFVIDEAHCISQMGHDFRNDYLQLGGLRRAMKDVPVLCLTATATEMVVSDVCDSLSLRPVVLRGPTDRPNLFYEVRHKGSDSEVAEAIATLILTEFKDSSGIVYVLSRKDAEELAHSLSFGYGIRAGFYHGDVSSTERGRTYSRWIEGSLQVICATISFGLGIDKQDCRFIIHKELATSLEGYYQESGRAGRDGYPARCILFYRPSDVLRLASFVASKGTDRVPKVVSSAKYAAGSSNVPPSRVNEKADGLKRPREAFALSCRRAILASAFGETPPQRVDDAGGSSGQHATLEGFGLASKCCDLCARNGDYGHVRVDVTPQALAMALALRSYHSRHPDEHLTANALCDAMGNTGRKGLIIRGSDIPPLPRVYDKDARMDVLLSGVLEECIALYHSYGMYSMQGYVREGPQARSIERGFMKVFIQVRKDHPLAHGDEKAPKRSSTVTD